MLVELRIGPVVTNVKAVIVPDHVLNYRIVGTDIGSGNLLTIMASKFATGTVTAESPEEKVLIVKTRAHTAMVEADERATAQVVLAEKPKTKTPDQIQKTMEVVAIPSVDELRSEGRDVVAGQVFVVNGVAKPLVEGELVTENAACMPELVVGESLLSNYKELIDSDDSLVAWKKLGMERKKGYFWKDGVLRRSVEDELQGMREVVVIPHGLRKKMLKLAHDHCGHVGAGKTLWLLRRSCAWPGMYNVVKSFCKACHECQVNTKAGACQAPMKEMPIVTMPFQHVAIDLVVPLPRAKGGWKYLLTYICLGSRYPEAIPLKTITAIEVAEALLEIFSRNGVPEVMLSDQGTQFVGSLMKLLCHRLGIDKIRTTPFHPQANGCVERFHGTLVPLLKKMVGDGLEWPQQLKFAL